MQSGSPAKIEIDLWDRYGAQLLEQREESNETITDVAIASLTALFLEIGSRSHTWGELFAIGLPVTAPDPMESF